MYNLVLVAIDGSGCYREALCLGETNDVALENFRKKFAEAIKNAWSVSLNWYIHNVARAGN